MISIETAPAAGRIAALLNILANVKLTEYSKGRLLSPYLKFILPQAAAALLRCK